MIILDIQLILLFQIIVLSKASRQELNWTDNVVYGCNFTTNENLKTIKTDQINCQKTCISTYGCSHFVWSSHENGICVLKKKNVSRTNVIASNDQSSFCGIVEENPWITDVQSLKHTYINDEGTCLLPTEDYAVTYPIALGNKETLGYLKFRPQLCGHVLEIDCGNGKFEAVVMNSNFGGGLDLYDTLWEAAIPKRNKKMGEAMCNVTLAKKNPFKTEGYRCYHGTDQTDNVYFRSVGLFNTSGRVVIGAQFNGRNGTLSENGYFTFYNFGTDEDLVTFYFEFGGSFSIYLKDCPGKLNNQKWS